MNNLTFNMDKQNEEEVRIFTEFTKICPYPIDFGSIEHREPPEPDILCKLSNGTSIAFELVECIDKHNVARLYSDSKKLKKTFSHELEKLPNDKKQKFNTLYILAHLDLWSNLVACR